MCNISTSDLKSVTTVLSNHNFLISWKFQPWKEVWFVYSLTMSVCYECFYLLSIVLRFIELDFVYWNEIFKTSMMFKRILSNIFTVHVHICENLIHSYALHWIDSHHGLSGECVWSQAER